MKLNPKSICQEKNLICFTIYNMDFSLNSQSPRKINSYTDLLFLALPENLQKWLTLKTILRSLLIKRHNNNISRDCFKA